MSCARSESLPSKNASSRLITTKSERSEKPGGPTRTVAQIPYQRTTLSQPKDDAAHARKRSPRSLHFLVHTHRRSSNLVTYQKPDRDRSLTGVLAARSLGATCG